MSMLAESRRKKKWSVDPQGKRWSKDNDKIGQKMLEKMGWTDGKGLGVNEQGIIEHVRVNKRNPEYEKAGIGYNNSHMKDICEHQDKFNEFLQQLSKHHNQEETVEKSKSDKGDLSEQSLELKSKQSRARLHYKKFTRSKDVSKYNSKDLANIFGKKELTSTSEVNDEDNSIYENEASGTKDNWNNVVTINRGSMSDYFKQKLPNHKKVLSNIDNQTTDSENEVEQHVGFGFTPKTENIYSTNEIPKNLGEKSNYAFDNPCLGMNSPTETTFNAENSVNKSRKKKRKEFVPETTDVYVEETNEVNVGKRLKIEIVDNNYKDGFTNPALNLDTKLNEACNGKEFEVSRAQFGLENCGLDLTDEKSNKKRVTFNDHVEYNTDATKRKKGKTTLDKFEVENKKHKKKRKHSIANETITTLSNGFVNEALDIEILSVEMNDNELNEHKSTKIKKRKICKISNLETIQESPEQEKEIIEINLEDVISDTIENKETDIAVKKPKKKKKNKKEIKIMDDNIVGVKTENIIIEKIIRNKKHKLDKKEIHSKEKEKDKEECESAPNKILEKLETKQQHTNHLVKIKTKKSRKQEIIIDNSANGETSPVVITISEEDISLEKENTIQKKKKRNKKDSCLENEINMCDVEKEVSDKENAIEEQESNIKLLKKNKKHKRLKDTSDVESSISSSAEITDTNISNQENVNNVEFINTPSKKNQVTNFTNDGIHSPLDKKPRMTKKILKRFFYGNLIADFPGSNIQEMKGYGMNDNGN